MMFYKVAQLGKSKLGTKTLMSGEISDGAHNLGFSQFLTSFDHENQGYREYSDKQFNYLFSPNFLEKVLKNNSTDDFIFNKLSKSKRIKFKKKFSSNNISLHNQIFDDLFNSQNRFPFESKESKIVSSNLLNKSKDYHKKNYFNEIKLSKSNQLLILFTLI